MRQEFGFNNDEFKDILNQVLPERLQLMREKKLKSNEIWKMLIHSSEVVDNLNLWLNNHMKNSQE